MSQVRTLPSYQEGLEDLGRKLGEMLPSDSLKVFDTDALALANSIEDILVAKVGAKAPDFTLGNAVGIHIRLTEVLKSSKVVLVFYRGTWCPYCNLALAQYQQSLPEFEALGAKLMAISPQTPDESLQMAEKNALQFEVLSDNNNLVAKQYTHVFKYGDIPLAEMEKLGFDFESYYSDDSHEIPVPAVFVIEKGGTISFAKSEGGDYRKRTEVSEIISHLNKS